MSFAAPWFLLGGALAALAVIALHFLIRQQPERWQLPTTRFVPETQELAPARSLALNDKVLLALRMLAIAAAALAFARPSFDAVRPALVRVVVEDRSSSVGDTAEVTRAVAALGGAQHVIQMTDRSLSAGLVRAIREAHALRDAADSVAIVLVSPLVREQFDAATLAIRSTWAGAIAWKSVKRRTTMTPSAGGIVVGFRGSAEDPLRATFSLMGMAFGNDVGVLVVRDSTLGAADSSWARGAGRVLVHWRTALAVRDTIGAVVTDRTVLVAGFARPASPDGGTPVAWWADGAVAATESAIGEGCIRSVAVPVSSEGDLVLRERFGRLVRDLTGPCGGARDLRPADSATVAAITGTAPAAVATSSLPPLPEAGRAAMPWLLALALLFLVAEQLVRRWGEQT